MFFLIIAYKQMLAKILMQKQVEIHKNWIKTAVSFFHPTTASRASWGYYTHYSTAQQNLEQSVSIARHNFWKKVYYGLSYKAYSNYSWGVIQNEWRKLSNNQSVSYTRNPCYQFKVRIKTKKTSAYSVNFSY